MPGAASQDPGEYSALFVTEGYADLQATFIRLHDLLDIGGYPALATLLRQAFFRFRDDMLRIAKETAVKATEYIKEAEVSTRVRKDSGGDSSGHRLNDYVGESVALTGVPGSVGVNFEPLLYDNVPWWWTNEEGYSGHVGRVVHGFFYEQGYTAASRPDISRFREHPLFRAEGPQTDERVTDEASALDYRGPSGKGVRPSMLIQNPIPKREFVLKGSQRAEAEWHRSFAVAKARFDKEMARISAMIQPRPPGKP